ncbi:MAG TPA: DNA mismatch repair protein MutS [Bacilli bacterium]|nr:DNA mismatch repair protein MutS [Bacilli bacterium]
MNRKDVDVSKVSPMMKQYLDIKEQNEDVILFFRLGDFYEMFFEDAKVISKELDLVLTGKNAGLDERIPMCGIPHHAVNIYLDKLIDKGYKVAICEQIEDPKLAKGVVKREVIQVVSKGTIMSEDMLDENKNNYIASVVKINNIYGLSYTDLSTGEFNTTIIESLDLLLNEILKININEIVLEPDFDFSFIQSIKKISNITVSFESNKENIKDYSSIYKDISDYRLLESIKLLINYLVNTQKRNLMHLQKVVYIDNTKYLKLDLKAKRNLELTENIRTGEKLNSLLWLLDKTKTAMGSRMLKNMIENPIYDKKELEKRYDMVGKLSSEFLIKDELIEYLSEIYDLERLCGRVAYNTANAKDLLQLKVSIQNFPRIKKLLKDLKYYDNIDDLSDLYELIDEAIYENPPLGLKEGYLIKEKYNKELDVLKDSRKGGKSFIAALEEEEKIRTGIKNLKVGFNKIFGYYIEVSKGNKGLIKEEYNYERKQTLANCERYITPILKEKETMILNAEEKIINLEYDLFVGIREQVKKYINKIQNSAKVIAKIDVLQSFSKVSEDNNYVRPILIDNKHLKIINGRHPVVEKVIDTEFVPNDVIFDNSTNILLITGPNMAGKSTYMRQVAIIVIMAQIGCFVPAEEAYLPLIDQIFTRIGASDDLVSGESTFMVEMLEANNAIKNATANSLIIFDELGRGTATYDGMSLAQAIIEYIHDNISALTMFSTHYHELTKLENSLKHLKNIHVSAYEENENIVFLHKVLDGPVDKSYGINVAKLANLPSNLIKRANEILVSHESNYKYKKSNVQIALNLNEQVLSDSDKKILDGIKSIDPSKITPLEALNILYDIHNNKGR